LLKSVNQDLDDTKTTSPLASVRWITLKETPAISRTRDSVPFDKIVSTKLQPFTFFQELKCHKHGVNSMAFSPDGGRLAFSSGGAIRIWAADKQGKLEQVQELKGYRATSLAFSPDGRQLMSTEYRDYHKAAIRIWELDKQGKLGQVQKLKGDNEGVCGVAFSPNGGRLAYGGGGGPYGREDNIRIWAINKQDELEQVQELDGNGSCFSVAYSADGRLALADRRGNGRTIQIWAANKQGKLEQVQELKGHKGTIASVAFHLIGAGSRPAAMRKRSGFEQVQELNGPSAVYSVAFSHDGRWLASGGTRNRIWVWAVKE
jgi:WD40 repeat protein